MLCWKREIFKVGLGTGALDPFLGGKFAHKKIQPQFLRVFKGDARCDPLVDFWAKMILNRYDSQIESV